MNWKKYDKNSADNENIDQSRLYIVHCPEWSASGYEVASWDGLRFETGRYTIHGDFIESYAVLQEVDEDA